MAENTSTVRLLYMEDDPGLARLIQKRLQRRNYEVTIASNGEIGLSLIAKKTFDIVMIDYDMPVKNGLDVLAEMQEGGEYPPTIMMSALDSVGVAVEAMKLGASDYLLKQPDTAYLDILPTILERLLEKQRLLDTIKNKQQQLNQRKQILQATLSNISQGVVVFDHQFNLVIWNKRYRELLGYPESAVQTGVELDSLFLLDHRAGHPSPLETLLSAATPGDSLDRSFRFEWELIDGTVLDVYTNPMPSGGFVATYTNITEKKKQEQFIHYQATHDKLTGLPNRQLLDDRLQQAMALAKRNSTWVVLALIDLDNFKHVNDTFGHAEGDKLLKIIAERLQKCVRKSDTVARLGGDEFVLILNNQDRQEVTLEFIRRVLDIVAQPMDIAGKEFQTTCSLGFSVFPVDGNDPVTLLKMADIAMYHAKAEGRNRFRYFTRDMQQQLAVRLDKEEKLRHALKTNELKVFYQPKVDLISGEIIGGEALLRWYQPELGQVPPSEFIPFAEEIGLIMAIDDWVINQVCLQIKKWQMEGVPVQPIAVNISAITFMMKNLDTHISSILSKHAISAEHIILEITETASMQDIDKSIETMRRLRQLGIFLSLDDFGSGYSNLKYLRQFPVNSIKIDRSFISGLPGDPMDLAIIKAIIALGHSLGIKIVAEGVETEAQLNLLTINHCDHMQGYYFSKPVQANEFGQMLKSGKGISADKLGRQYSGRAVLFVDDDTHLLSSLKRGLRKSGYALFIAESGMEALDIMAKEEIGVVVSDHKMPLMSGVEMLSRVKFLHPHITRILMSGMDDQEMAVDAINRGEVYKFMSKPVCMDTLRNLLEEAFMRHEVVRQQDAVTSL